MDTQTIILANLIIFAAFFIKGMSGFANALIMVPLLALIMDLQSEVVPLSAMLGITSHAILLPTVWKHISKEDLFIVIFVMIGTFIGTHFLVSYSSDILKVVLGIVIMVFSVQIFFNKTFENIAKWWGVVAGLAGGILGGMFTTNGPPIVIYFGNKLKKGSFRATLITIFFIDAIWMNSLYIMNGVTTIATAETGLMLLPALLLGLFLGTKLHHKIDENLFKKIVAAILFFVGITFII